jgi:hypothetical protein
VLKHLQTIVETHTKNGQIAELFGWFKRRGGSADGLFAAALFSDVVR